MQCFDQFLNNVPTMLAMQDALTNSVGSVPGAPGTAIAPGTPLGNGGGGVGGPAPAANPFGMIWMVLVVLGVMIGFSMLSSRKEKKKRAELLSSIKKGEKVLTIGGIIGTVAEVRDDEVVLRVDENSNTRMRFTRSSIQQVLKSVAGDGVAGTDSGEAQGGASGGVNSGSGSRTQIEVKSGKGAKARA